MHSAGCDVAFQPRLHFFQDRAPVGIVTQANYGQEHGLLERPKHIRHNGYIVVFERALSRSNVSHRVQKTANGLSGDPVPLSIALEGQAPLPPDINPVTLSRLPPATSPLT
jgi:hypothetical protein